MTSAEYIDIVVTLEAHTYVSNSIKIKIIDDWKLNLKYNPFFYSELCVINVDVKEKTKFQNHPDFFVIA